MPIRRQIKNVVNNYTEGEVKVREATSNDPWGPSSTLMSEIADATYNVMEFGPVMTMVWRRLNDHGKNWRHVYKALVVLEYLIKTGSERVYQQSREHVFTIQTLKDFQFVDKDGKDQGVNVREKAKQLVLLLKDDDRLKAEREKALKAKERFAQANTAISSSQVAVKFGGNKKQTPAAAGSGTVRVPVVSHVATTTPTTQPTETNQATTTTTTTTTPPIEQARPTDTAEEDMQLQLAIALSRQQAEHDKELRMAEEVRLQRVIEQSKATTSQPTPGGATLLDISAQSSSSAKSGFESDFVSPDPWSVKNPAGGANSGDPWAPAAAAAASARRQVPAWESMDTPFGAGPAPVQSPPAQPVKEPYDVFGAAPAPVETAAAAPVAFDMTPIQQSLPHGGGGGDPPPTDKKPQAFLGEHSSLVNVDSLLGNKPSIPPAAASSNPFLSNAPSAAVAAPASTFGPSFSVKPMQTSNPFANAQKPKTKTLNELRTQTSMGYTSGPSSGSLLPPPLLPDSSAPVRSGQPAPGLTYSAQQSAFSGGFGQPVPSQGGNPFSSNNSGGFQW